MAIKLIYTPIYHYEGEKDHTSQQAYTTFDEAKKAADEYEIKKVISIDVLSICEED